MAVSVLCLLYDSVINGVPRNGLEKLIYNIDRKIYPPGKKKLPSGRKNYPSEGKTTLLKEKLPF